ncbi:hypothetical protein U0070_013794, partial [Myodes glareolus]
MEPRSGLQARVTGSQGHRQTLHVTLTHTPCLVPWPESVCQKHSRSSIKLLGKDGGAATPRCLGLGCDVTGGLTDCFLPGDLQCHSEPPARLFTPVAPPPLSSVSSWYLFIYFPSCASGDPKPHIPLALPASPRGLAGDQQCGVFIYRAYDFNFSIKKSEQ